MVVVPSILREGVDDDMDMRFLLRVVRNIFQFSSNCCMFHEVSLMVLIVKSVHYGVRVGLRLMLHDLRNGMFRMPYIVCALLRVVLVGRILFAPGALTLLPRAS